MTPMGLMTASLTRLLSTNPSICTTSTAMPGLIPNLTSRITRSELLPKASLMRASFSLSFLLRIASCELRRGPWPRISILRRLDSKRFNAFDNIPKATSCHPLKSISRILSIQAGLEVHLQDFHGYCCLLWEILSLWQLTWHRGKEVIRIRHFRLFLLWE